MALSTANDLVERAVVWLFHGHSNSDDDYAQYIASIADFDARCAGKDGAALVVVDAGNPPPNSAWRKKIADGSAHLLSKPVFALVSPSPIVRGAVTAINWIRPPAYPFTTAARVDTAIAWIEAQLGRPVPLAALVARARATIAKSA